MNEAIKFGLYLSNNLYEERWQDIDDDGKTWVCMNDEGFEENNTYRTSKRYTIKEIYNKFKKQEN